MTKRDKIIRDILWQLAAVLSKSDMSVDRRKILKLYILLDKLEDLK